jgi:hypothetical protein
MNDPATAKDLAARSSHRGTVPAQNETLGCRGRHKRAIVILCVRVEFASGPASWTGFLAKTGLDLTLCNATINDL